MASFCVLMVKEHEEVCTGIQYARSCWWVEQSLSIKPFQLKWWFNEKYSNL